MINEQEYKQLLLQHNILPQLEMNMQSPKKETIGRLSDEIYDIVTHNAIRTCVDLVVLLENGVLLTQRQIPPFENLYHMPGGIVKKGEPLAQSVDRIASAELGSPVYIHGLLGLLEMDKDGPMPDGSFQHSNSSVLLVTPYKTQYKLDNQASKYSIFDSLPDNMHPYHGQFLESRLDAIMSVAPTAYAWIKSLSTSLK